jgi:stage II sporulation protein D
MLIVLAVLMAFAQTLVPSHHAPGLLPDNVELVPLDGTAFDLGRGSYVGPIEVVATDAGLGVVETRTLDDYLTGLREVPATWPAEALAAQAVAGRTFVVWSIARGRTRAGRLYGYDICATSACQVYRGSAIATDPAAAPWVAAVNRTAGEILVYEGAPAHTFYSSSAGSRTRPVQDIWGGSPTPYLVAVDSPEAGVTPYEQWIVELSADVFNRILVAAGLNVGAGITGISVDRPPEGEGTSTVVVATEDGIIRIGAGSFRSLLNRYGSALYPGLLPAPRPGGRRWPQAILSYTFDIEWEPGGIEISDWLARLLPASDRPQPGIVRIVGEGWGHGVGMSQWGAKAMSDEGATYAEILGHYYNGLQPEVADLPEQVRIGLVQDALEVTIAADGPFELKGNGFSLGLFPAGTWVFRHTASGVGVVPPPEVAARSVGILGRKWPR